MKDFAETERQINELTDRIHATFKLRDRDEVHYQRWRTACAEFHRRYETLAFAACYELDGGLRQCAESAIEASIAFLLADPYYFRSGYIKEYIWRHLPSCRLTEDQIEKIEYSASGYLERQIGREFWYMCRAINRIARKSFWSRLAGELDAYEPEKKARASYLLAYRDDISQGEKVHHAVFRQVLKDKYGKS